MGAKHLEKSIKIDAGETGRVITLGIVGGVRILFYVIGSQYKNGSQKKISFSL